MQREALVCRVAEGRPPRDFAGLYVAADDLDRVLRSLPGLDGPDPSTVDPVRASVAEPLEAARKALSASLDGDDAFATLCRAAGLDGPAAEVLALLVAVEMSAARQRLVAYLQDSVHLPQLTLGTLARILDGGEKAVAPDAPLLRAALVEISGTGPWASRTCAPPARVVWHLRGDTSADPGLPAGAAVSPAGAADRDGAAVSAAGAAVGPSGAGKRIPSELVLINGGDAQSRLRAVAERWPGAARVESPVPADPTGWAALVREATIGGAVVVLDLERPLDPAARDAITRAAHLRWVLCSALEQPLDSLPALPWREIRVPSGEADESDWQRLLGRGPDPQYRLGRDQLRLVAAASDGGPIAPAVRRLAGGHLDGVAVRIRPRRGWDDLVLPPDDVRQLRELAVRHRRRDVVYGRWGFPPLPSTGVVALFAGPSGTGKTLAAEVVAGVLGLDLYKVDLSAVVSKYIGETEKNLERIFGAAAAGDLVLFFDEADALFGKRSEVSDAHDRYANIEVAYLLQRLETYDGLVVLATNLQRNIDQAFLRRISVAIDFTLPEEPERKAIWSRAFPSSAPVGDLDIEFLARQFKVSGGIIRNAALGAAFLAADDDTAITMRHAVLAMKREFQKMGRLRTEAEFERYFELVD
ncbi:ATP-binding protein [Virgisporangium ochraceum]|uniref:ATP-binding protein n=1 Tax=Virgisporangium ochraceum TaxID=65505 RepID=UPI001EF1E83A|nr:ATP-binding protein [Virgisporangium ochraceum]